MSIYIFAKNPRFIKILRKKMLMDLNLCGINPILQELLTREKLFLIKNKQNP